MKRILDREFGAAELNRDDPLVAEALALGWARYDESFDEEMYCAPLHDDGSEYSFVGFQLSGSKTQLLCCVYDPAEWKIEFPVFDEDDSWLDPRAGARERKFYGKDASHA